MAAAHEQALGEQRTATARQSSMAGDVHELALAEQAAEAARQVAAAEASMAAAHERALAEQRAAGTIQARFRGVRGAKALNQVHAAHAAEAVRLVFEATAAAELHEQVIAEHTAEALRQVAETEAFMVSTHERAEAFTAAAHERALAEQRAAGAIQACFRGVRGAKALKQVHAAHAELARGLQRAAGLAHDKHVARADVLRQEASSYRKQLKASILEQVEMASTISMEAGSVVGSVQHY